MLEHFRFQNNPYAFGKRTFNFSKLWRKPRNQCRIFKNIFGARSLERVHPELRYLTKTTAWLPSLATFLSNESKTFILKFRITTSSTFNNWKNRNPRGPHWHPRAAMNNELCCVQWFRITNKCNFCTDFPFCFLFYSTVKILDRVTLVCVLVCVCVYECSFAQCNQIFKDYMPSKSRL